MNGSATAIQHRRRVPSSVGAAAELACAVRGDSLGLRRVIRKSGVPTLIVDRERHVVDANSAARLALRLSLADLRSCVIGDLTPPAMLDELERAWAQLLHTGSVAGHYHVALPDDSRLDVVYCAMANLLPGLHLIAFAPAVWPEDELAAVTCEAGGSAMRLTRREIEVLELAAEGSEVHQLAEQLAVSPATVRTHLKNIYAKLQAHNRTAAVVKAMRLGLIAC
jgi:DNA-binding CsgD family transcriptional regulator